MIYFSDRIFFCSFLFPLFVLVFAISLSGRKDKPGNELTQVRIKDVVRIAANRTVLKFRLDSTFLYSSTLSNDTRWWLYCIKSEVETSRMWMRYVMCYEINETFSFLSCSTSQASYSSYDSQWLLILLWLIFCRSKDWLLVVWVESSKSLTLPFIRG